MVSSSARAVPAIGTLAEGFDGVLFDLDGVVYRGEFAVPHAAQAIGSLASPVGYVTNNASRSPQDVAQHLRELGVPATPDQVFTSALAAAAIVAETYGRGTKVLMVGGPGLRVALEGEGLRVVDSAEEAPEVVVQGTSQQITWAHLAEAVYAINAGAAYVATNLDSTMPTERGMALGNGALVQAVSHATGVRPAVAAGKPQPEIFTHAAARSQMRTPLVVGDRLDTDIKGANAAGFAGLLVLTGVADPREVLTSPEPSRPSFIAHDLRALHQAYPPTVLDGNRWRCGQSYAHVTGAALTVERGEQITTLTGPGEAVEISLDELRAACGAAWSNDEPFAFEREIHIRT